MKKTMKKNALLSSVAMLIVSAIVLTSATYAWFSAAKEAKIEGFSVNVQAAEGLQMSVDGGTTWKNNFVASDIIGKPGAIVADVLMPVSTTNFTDFVGGAINESEEVVLTSVGAAEKGFYQFKIKLRAFSDMTLTLKDSTFNANKDSTKKAMKIALKPTVAGSNIVMGFDNLLDSWNGVSTTGNVPTSGGIITTGTEITPVAKETPTIALSANVEVEYTVSVWLEGNDPDCVMPSEIPNDQVTFALNFKDINAA